MWESCWCCRVCGYCCRPRCQIINGQSTSRGLRRILASFITTVIALAIVMLLCCMMLNLMLYWDGSWCLISFWIFMRWDQRSWTLFCWHQLFNYDRFDLWPRCLWKLRSMTTSSSLVMSNIFFKYRLESLSWIIVVWKPYPSNYSIYKDKNE